MFEIFLHIHHCEKERSFAEKSDSIFCWMEAVSMGHLLVFISFRFSPAFKGSVPNLNFEFSETIEQGLVEIVYYSTTYSKESPLFIGHLR